MKKDFYIKTIAISLFLLSLIFIFWRFSENLRFSDNSWTFSERKSFEITQKDNLLQKFSASRDGFSGLELLLTSKHPEKKISFYLDVMDENCSNILRQKTITIKEADSETPLFFSFERIKDSQNRIFCLSLSFKSENEKQKTSIYLSKKPHSQSISLVKAGAEMENMENLSLAMRPVYKNANTVQDLNEVNQRISQYKPFFLKHYFLWAITILFLALSIGLAVLLIVL